MNEYISNILKNTYICDTTVASNQSFGGIRDCATIRNCYTKKLRLTSRCASQESPGNTCCNVWPILNSIVCYRTRCDPDCRLLLHMAALLLASVTVIR